MANTRDTYGDQETVDGLIENTLTEIEEDGVTALGSNALTRLTSLTSARFPNVTTLGMNVLSGCSGLLSVELPLAKSTGTNALQNCTGLTSIKLPSATSIGTSSFSKCSNLETVDLAGSAKVTLSSGAFENCPKLKSLIIRSSTMSSMGSTSVLSGSQISFGYGGIYVPANLVASYRAGTNWQKYKSNIFPIDEYPRTVFETITDTWAQIAAAESDGTYITKYAIGDTKALTIGEGVYYAQIAAFDADPLASGNGNAKITWIVRETVGENHAINAEGTSAGGWLSSEMRTYLRETLLPTFQSDVRGMIKEVTKTYYDYGTRSTLSCTDTIWIPSLREVNGKTSGAYVIEDSGPVYSGLFPTNGNSSMTQRSKHNLACENSTWWLRSAYTGTAFDYIQSSSGNVSYFSSAVACGVVPGFCT